MWERIKGWRGQFWFLPAVMVTAAVVVAQFVLWTDSMMGRGIPDWVPGSLRLGVEGSRGLLTAVGGSMLAVAGTSFSITISVIATASSSYGPRLVKNFMADWRNQIVLGLFVATFVYTLLVQRAVTSADEDIGRESFIPFLGVYLALLLALVNVGALVYFLHHISESIEVPHLIHGVRTDFEQVAHSRYGGGVPGNAMDGPSILGHAVTARRAGYVTQIDEVALFRLARRNATVIQVVAGPGAHVTEGDVLARIGLDGGICEVEAVIRCFTIGTSRSAHQDPRYAAQQLTEMAVRALSPGTNDPYTARNAIAELTSGLVIVAANPRPPRGRGDAEGALRLVLDVPSAWDIIDWTFTDLRTHAATDPGVIWDIIFLAGRLVRVAPPELADRIRHHVELLIQAYAEQGVDFDTERLREWQQTQLG